jgi:4-amino-4-deoxy-L-arabinose transferase-like glycosyltransferase
MSRHHLAIICLWLLLVVISLTSRTFIPLDETRYVAVAWNMWLRGDFLVPYLNNIPYSHKPPLLFWLMNAGWAVFGVNDWWPRLVPSLFALGSVLLTAKIAAKLWPSHTQTMQIAPVILLGSGLWMVFTTATMFDLMIAFFTLLGVLGLLIAWQEKGIKGWLLLGLAIGGGLLAKGPTILLQLLPLAILAPWWSRDAGRHSWKTWYVGILAAVILGVLIVLLWAIPAGMRGGAEYQHDIFWGQTADRMVNSFAHRRPFWWYVPALPLMLFPWLLWLRLWRGFAAIKLDFGVRFCLAWLLPVFIAFSFISGKQVHYLLPIFPAFALLAAKSLAGTRYGRFDVAPILLLTLLAATVLLALPYYVHSHHLALWIGNIAPWTGIALVLAAIALWRIKQSSLVAEVWQMTLFSTAVVLISVYFAVVQSAELAYDVRPVAAQLKALQDAGTPLAHVGKYAGQYQFLGRMTREPELIEESGVSDWFKKHPDGKLVTYFSARLPLAEIQPDYSQAYRGDHVVILSRQSWDLVQAHPVFTPDNQ